MPRAGRGGYEVFYDTRRTRRFPGRRHVHRPHPAPPRGPRPPQLSRAVGTGVRSDPDTLHRVYTALMSHESFRLWGKHSKALHTRGLPWAAHTPYCTNPDKKRAHAVHELIAAGLEADLPRVP